jgi:hypothetical protein
MTTEGYIFRARRLFPWPRTCNTAFATPLRSGASLFTQVRAISLLDRCRRVKLRRPRREERPSLLRLHSWTSSPVTMSTNQRARVPNLSFFPPSDLVNHALSSGSSILDAAPAGEIVHGRRRLDRAVPLHRILLGSKHLHQQPSRSDPNEFPESTQRARERLPRTVCAA